MIEKRPNVFWLIGQISYFGRGGRCAAPALLAHPSWATPLSFPILVTHQRSHSRLGFVRIANLDSFTDVFFFLVVCLSLLPPQILRPLTASCLSQSV